MTGLELRDLRLAYGGGANHATVLGPFDWTLAHGQRAGLAGESGSGKTTLLELAAGLRIPGIRTVTGSLTWTGDPSIAYIPQESSNSLSPFLTALDHVRGVCRDYARSIEILEELGLDENKHNAYPCQLSGGERQRVLVAMALAANPGFILADEPTANLDPANTALVCNALSNTNAALLVVSHREELFERLGCNGIHRLTPRPNLAHATTLETSTTEPILDIRGLRHAHVRRDFWLRTRPTGFALHDISLTIHAKELVTLSGPSGSGKSTLARCIIQTHPTAQLVEQEPSNTLNPNQRLAAALHEANPQTDAARALTEVGLPAAWISRKASELSEGQRARVAIARALAACPENGLLILDESLSGLDEATERAVLDAIRLAQHERNLGCLVIAHDPRFPAHRALRMQEGRLSPS